MKVWIVEVKMGDWVKEVREVQEVSWGEDGGWSRDERD